MLDKTVGRGWVEQGLGGVALVLKPEYGIRFIVLVSAKNSFDLSSIHGSPCCVQYRDL
jgi:hypothetical protein